MIEYGLKVNEATGKVRYVMVQKDGNVQAETPYESAVWMLKRGKVRTSGKIEGYPLTADGVYFFESEDCGDINQTVADEASCQNPSVSCADSSPLKGSRDGVATSGATEGGDIENTDVEIGADGLPLLAGDGTKRRRRRVKDVVCE